MSFAAIWMVLEIVILSEGSQNDKEKYHAVTYKQNLKRNVTNELAYKTEKTLADFKNQFIVARWKG